jgi:hypothetical protein
MVTEQPLNQRQSIPQSIPGFGDVVLRTALAEVLVTIEVILGYLMLGTCFTIRQ